MAEHSVSITPALEQYLRTYGVGESPELCALREATQSNPAHRMQISPEQGQFMGFMVKALGVKRILEMGTFTGYSALAMAQSLPPDGKVVTLDKNPSWTQMAQRHWQEAGMGERIQLILGPAGDTLASLIEGGEPAFDLIFIDADKSNYDHYYELGLQLLSQQGVILLDNMLWSGKVAMPEVKDSATRALRALNEKISQDARVDFCLATVGDGLMMVRKKMI